MRILLLGATGRVGSSALSGALSKAHHVTVLVRDPARLGMRAGLDVVTGDVKDEAAILKALGFVPDAVANAVGVDPLKPSTFVTDTTRVLVRILEAHGPKRYVAVSGTACMPKTAIGRVAERILALTPVRHAIRDHKGAYDIVSASALDWTLVGCPWIKDGPVKTFSEHHVFPGGMRVIRPEQVGAFLIEVLERPIYTRRIVGIWED